MANLLRQDREDAKSFNEGIFQMSIPILVKQLVEKKLTKFCDKRIPEHVKSQVRLEYVIKGNNVTLCEKRPFFLDKEKWTESKIAQFRYDHTENKWTLFCTDRNSKWHEYTVVEPNSDFNEMLKEVDKDPTGIFWG